MGDDDCESLEAEFEDVILVSPSLPKGYEISKGKFEDAMSNSMMLDMSPELSQSVVRDDEDEAKSVNYVMKKLREPVHQKTSYKHNTMETISSNTDKPSPSAAQPSTKSTKTTNNDKVAKRIRVTQHKSKLSVDTASKLKFMGIVDKLEKSEDLESDVLSSNKAAPAPEVLPGIRPRKIDESYEFDSDGNEILT